MNAEPRVVGGGGGCARHQRRKLGIDLRLAFDVLGLDHHRPGTLAGLSPKTRRRLVWHRTLASGPIRKKTPNGRRESARRASLSRQRSQAYSSACRRSRTSASKHDRGAGCFPSAFRPSTPDTGLSAAELAKTAQAMIDRSSEIIPSSQAGKLAFVGAKADTEPGRLHLDHIAHVAHRKPLRRHPGPSSQSRREGTLCEPEEAASPGRHHPEWRARSSRNAGRHRAESAPIAVCPEISATW
ncbi:hypothetical protein ACVILL_001091 [Bradyrhizobium sp. USDA 3364]